MGASLRDYSVCPRLSCQDAATIEGLSGPVMPTLVVNEFRLYYEDAGEGSPLVFLSGLGGDTRAFSVAMRHFQSRYRTLAMDARDVGRSDRAKAPYTIVDMADDVAVWLRALGLSSAAVVGHSLGGMVA